MQKSDVIKFFNGTTKTALALGISKSTVSLWKSEVPWKYALLIEKVTQGKLKANISIGDLKN
ncbi:Cro/CI family transcriptional regulator [Morganella morganii]|uniref:Cro/CI family transcriptional regulator n=1 Tax=Morganella morganii TaxID=582 RepID=UPI00280D6811|nr:helix-turn-helix domain-containing protein [Morganella morganii]